MTHLTSSTTPTTIITTEDSGYNTDSSDSYSDSDTDSEAGGVSLLEYYASLVLEKEEEVYEKVPEIIEQSVPVEKEEIQSLLENSEPLSNRGLRRYAPIGNERGNLGCRGIGRLRVDSDPIWNWEKLERFRPIGWERGRGRSL